VAIVAYVCMVSKTAVAQLNVAAVHEDVPVAINLQTEVVSAATDVVGS